MSSKSVRRIAKDIKIYHSSDLNSHGIYIHFNEKNMYNAKALIIGPKESPYQNGFYFFDINYPHDYPQSPPNVILCTLNKKTRFNPNLYTTGKVCLSILGTWAGPGWTPCLSTNEVLLSIQSLLNNNPIVNEPGFEKENTVRNKNYNDLILFENFRTAIYKMILNTPISFDYFNSIMLKTFIENYNNIIKKIDQNINKNNRVVTFDLFHMKEKLEYNVVKTLLINLHKSIIEDNNILLCL